MTQNGDKRVSLTFIQNEMNETHTHIKDGLNLVIGLVLSNFVKPLLIGWLEVKLSNESCGFRKLNSQVHCQKHVFSIIRISDERHNILSRLLIGPTF